MAGTGRYQSRLLNYLVDQSHRFNAEAGRRLRQVRTGLTWSAQVLIYPLYVAFQTTRWAGRQLGRAKAVPPQPRFAAAAHDRSGNGPSADAVIQAIVALGQQLAEGEAIALPATSVQSTSAQSAIPRPGSPTTGAGPSQASANQAPAIAPTPQAIPSAQRLHSEPSPASALAAQANRLKTPDSPNSLETLDSLNSPSGLQIRAVASQLTNRALVLVDSENRPVPLAAEQQWSLQQALVQAVAEFNYRRRQQQLVQASQLPLPPPQPRPNQLPGVRWFGRLMGWMQTSPVAVSANLFEEARLPLAVGAIAPPPFLYWDQELNQALTTQALARLDGPLSQLETDYQAKAQRSDRWRGPVVFAAKLFGFEEAAEQWLAAREQDTEVPTHQTQRRPDALALISQRQPGVAIRPGSLAQATSARTTSAPADSADSLGVESTRAALQPEASKNVTIASRMAAAFAATMNSRSGLATVSVPTAGDAGAMPAGDLIAGRAPSPSTSAEPAGLPSLDPATALAQEASPTDVTHEPSYIETTATFSGYEKHPLELLLDWLDRGLLWLEQQGSRLWQWLRRLGEG